VNRILSHAEIEELKRDPGAWARHVGACGARVVEGFRSLAEAGSAVALALAESMKVFSLEAFEKHAITMKRYRGYVRYRRAYERRGKRR
jgi:hypothetical protein